MNYAISWITLEKYLQLSGDSIDAVMARQNSGKWTLGDHWKILEGRPWVNLAAVDRWHGGGAPAGSVPSTPDSECAPQEQAGPVSAGKQAAPLRVRKEEVLWDMAAIGQYLNRDPQAVRERMACLPSFPKAIRLPTKTGRAQPLFLAEEVIAWTKKFKVKN